MSDPTPKFIQEIDQGFGNIIEIKACLCDVQSDYQHIQIFETANQGKLMMLDGIIQFTEYDEFAYQEMMTHPALMLHENPEKVLIIGGGDGCDCDCDGGGCCDGCDIGSGGGKKKKK